MRTDESVSATDVSLLLRLRRDERDETAWRDFVELYGYRIYKWCLNRNLQPTDAEDVTQNVLVKLARKLGSFEYDPAQSFRGWLRRVTENALNDFYRERVETPAGSAIVGHLYDAEARTELIDQLEDAFDLELMEEAIRRVRTRISEQRFTVWQRMSREGARGAELAKELEMKIASVYTARSQVNAMIRDEIASLEKREFDRLNEVG